MSQRRHAVASNAKQSGRTLARVPLGFCLLALLFASGLASAEVAKPEQALGNSTCPPDGSRIALFSRQALDEGREFEGREYGKYTEELFAISASSYVVDDVIEKSIAATINFSKKMRAKGNDIKVVDLIIDREKIVSDLLRDKSLHNVRAAQLELQLAVVREMKRIMCHQSR